MKFLNEQERNAICERIALEPGDIAFFVADRDETVFASLGALRLKLGEKLGLIPEMSISCSG